MVERDPLSDATPRAAIGILTGAGVGVSLAIVMGVSGLLRFMPLDMVALLSVLTGAIAGGVVGWVRDSAPHENKVGR